MLFKIITGAVFIAVMVAFSRLVAKPAAESFGWWALIVAAAIFFPIAFWIDARDKRKRQEAEQAALRVEAARLHDDITDSLSRPQRDDVIDGEFTVVRDRR